MSAHIRLPLAVLTALTPFVASGAVSDAAQGKPARAVPFEEATMIIELNSTDLDVGIQFFLDVDSWKSVEISNPAGEEIFEVETNGRLTRQGGGTELFMESTRREELRPLMHELQAAAVKSATLLFEAAGYTPVPERIDELSRILNGFVFSNLTVAPEPGGQDVAGLVERLLSTFLD